MPTHSGMHATTPYMYRNSAKTGEAIDVSQIPTSSIHGDASRALRLHTSAANAIITTHT